MSKKSLKPVSLAVGSAFVASLAVSNISAATDIGKNPFAMNEMSGGYMQLATGDGYGGDKSEKEGKCGEGKYGEKKSEKEGKCGEGKCGSKDGMKKNMESNDGNKKVEKEGKCGDKK